MPTRLTYAEKLRDPRWQRKRLEIMERAGFHCEACGSDQDALNVHHGYYERGLEPWEYPSETLHCLCERCHLEHHELDLRIRQHLSKCHMGHLFQILGYIRALEFHNQPDPDLLLDPEDYLGAVGIGHFYGLSVATVISAIGDGGKESDLYNAKNNSEGSIQNG